MMNPEDQFIQLIRPLTIINGSNTRKEYQWSKRLNGNWILDRLLFVHVLIARAGEDDDAVNAEAFINKASFLVTSSQNDVLNLQYKVCYARILDMKTKYIETPLQYCGISLIETSQTGDE